MEFRDRLWVLGRRLLGRRGTFLLRNFLAELNFMFGSYEDPRSRPFGVSAMVCTYNEEDWVVEALLSAKELVDEYVVVDSSTDRTPELVMKLRDEGLNIRLYRIPPGDLVSARTLAIKEAKYRWILHLDADFIFYDWAPKYLRKYIEELDERKHYLIYWPWILICGDLRHKCSEEAYHIEHWLFTYSNTLKYKDLIINGKPLDHLIVPLKLYKVIYINKALGLHLGGIRKPSRLAIKHLWWSFRDEYQEEVVRGVSPEEFFRRKAKEVYGTEDLEEVGRKLINEMIKSLPLYSGEYPSVLMKYLT
ncbi:MAG: glycosyltransferase [Sulfolobales archaeon]